MAAMLPLEVASSEKHPNLDVLIRRIITRVVLIRSGLRAIRQRMPESSPWAVKLAMEQCVLQQRKLQTKDHDQKSQLRKYCVPL